MTLVFLVFTQESRDGFDYLHRVFLLFSFFLQSIIFIRDHNTVGQEVSGYIDYAHRLNTCDFDQIFSGKKKLMPGHSDLW